MRQQRLELGAHRLPVEPVQAGIVEERLLHPPDIAEDLLPLRHRIDQHPRAAQIDRLGLELLARIARQQLAVMCDQQELVAIAVGRDVGEAIADLFDLALLEIEPHQARAFAPAARACRRSGLRTLYREQCAVLGGRQAAIPCFGHRQGDDPALKALGSDDDRLLLLPGLVPLLIALLVIARCFFGLFGFLVGKDRAERGFAIGLEHGRIERCAERAILRRHVEPGIDRASIGRGAEKQQLAVLGEGRRAGVGKALADRVGAAGVQIVEVQRGVGIGAAGGVGKPAALGRDHRIEISVAARAGRDLPAGARRHVERAQAQPVGRIDDVLAHVAPFDELVEILAERDRAHRLDPALVLDPEHLARAVIGDVGKLRAVMRPDRGVIASGRAVRDVARGALVGRHGEDLAARGDRNARGRRGERRAGHLVADIAPFGPPRGQIGGERDRQGRSGATRHVERMEHAACLIDDPAALRGDVADIPVGLTGELGDLLACGIVAEDVRTGVPAVGQEIELAVHPHGVELGRAIARNVGLGAGGKVDQLERGGEPAAIAAPAIDAAGEHRIARAAGHIGEDPPALVIRPAADDRFGNLARRRAVERDVKELARPP